MYRRQFLQTLNAISASIVLPASAFYAEGPSDITPTNAIEVATSGWDIPKVGVVAVGGPGCAILSDITGRLPYLGLSIAVDTDISALQLVKADRKILVGDGKDLPLDPRTARLLAMSCRSKIVNAIAGLDMVFLVAGMGGVTGNSIAPVVVQMLREQDIPTLAFATLPPNFDSWLRQQHAQTGIRELRLHANALLPFTNENTGRIAEEHTSYNSVSIHAALAFTQLWKGILNPIFRPGCVNIDFEDLKHLILSHDGDCAFGFGSAKGMDGAAVAALHAIDHPMLGISRLQQASAILVAVRAPPGVLMLRDSKNAMKSISRQFAHDPWIIYGSYYDSIPDNEITVSILASGIPENQAYVATHAAMVLR